MSVPRRVGRAAAGAASPATAATGMRAAQRAGAVSVLDELQPFGVAGSWALNFRDEFDGSSIDTSKWIIAGGPEDPGTIFDGFGSQTWRPANLSVSGGILTATVDNAAGAARGCGICSQGKWTLGFGYYECRLKYAGAGGWPAWWIQAHTNGSAPAGGGEIDIAESKAFSGQPLLIQHDIHWNSYGNSSQQDTTVSDGQWHVFGLNWQPTFLDFYVDGSLSKHFTTAIMDPAQVAAPGQYMILNNASFTGGADAGTALFDYVRYWSGS